MSTDDENKVSISLEEHNAELMKLQASEKPAPRKNTGPIFGLLIILLALAGYFTGYVPLWVALAAAMVGLLGGILIQLSRIASK